MNRFHTLDREIGGRRVLSGACDTATRAGPGKDGTHDRAFAVPGLIGVCDGVSRTDQPARAADLICMWVAAHLAEDHISLGLLSDTVQDAIDYLEKRTGSRNRTLTATTISLAAVVAAENGERLLLGCTIGDSPLGYITETGQISWISSPDARHNVEAQSDDRVRSRGPLTQAMSPGTEIDPNLWVAPFPAGASAIVASDGLLDVAKPTSDLLSLPSCPTARGLCEAAAQIGSRDDIAVALYQPDLSYAKISAVHQPAKRRRILGR